MASVLSGNVLEELVARVKSPQDIDTVVGKFDPSSKDTPLFFQALSIAGKDDILEQYLEQFGPE